MTRPIDILLHTPWWAFALLLLLLVTGVQALQTRTLPVWRVLIVPSVFIVWGKLALALQLSWSSSFLLTDWLTAALLGAALMRLSIRPDAIHIAGPAEIRVAGSPLPLVRNMVIFFVKYGLAVAAALNPAYRPTIAIWDIAVSGLGSGYFLAWLAFLALTYRRTQRSEQLLAQSH
jgi:hypothetical protein